MVKYSDVKEMKKRKCKVCFEQWLQTKMKFRLKAKSYYKKWWLYSILNNKILTNK